MEKPGHSIVLTGQRRRIKCGSLPS